MTETQSSPTADAGTNGAAGPDPAAKPVTAGPKPETAAPKPAEAGAASPMRKESPASRPVLPWVLVALVVAAAVLFQAGAYLGLIAPPPSPAVTQLVRSMAAMETRVQGLEGRIAAQERGGGDPASREQLAKLVERVSTLEKTASAKPGIPPEVTQDLTAVKSAGEALDRRIAALEKSVAALPPQVGERLSATETALKGIADQHGSMVNRVEGIDQALRGHDASMAALTGEDRRLTHELARLQEGLAMLSAGERAAAEGASGVGRMQALLFGLAELRDRLRAGTPFTAELGTLKAVASDDKTVADAVAKLEPKAAKGLPTVEALRTRFEPIAAEMARADWVAAEGAWWSDALHRLSSLVTVRRTGPDVEGSSAEAVAARAEWRLRQGDLAGAVAAFNGLEGPGAKVAAAWLADAKARLGAEETVAELTRYALKQAAASP